MFYMELTVKVGLALYKLPSNFQKFLVNLEKKESVSLVVKLEINSLIEVLSIYYPSENSSLLQVLGAPEIRKNIAGTF